MVFPEACLSLLQLRSRGAPLPGAAQESCWGLQRGWTQSRPLQQQQRLLPRARLHPTVLLCILGSACPHTAPPSPCKQFSNELRIAQQCLLFASRLCRTLPYKLTDAAGLSASSLLYVCQAWPADWCPGALYVPAGSRGGLAAGRAGLKRPGSAGEAREPAELSGMTAVAVLPQQPHPGGRA